MTKRFTVPAKYGICHSKVQLNGQPLTNNEIVRIINSNDWAFIENFNLKYELNKLKKENKRLKRRLMIAQDKNRGLMK